MAHIVVQLVAKNINFSSFYDEVAVAAAFFCSLQLFSFLSFSVKLQNETSCDKLKKISAVLLRHNTLYIKLNGGKMLYVGGSGNKNERNAQRQI